MKRKTYRDRSQLFISAEKDILKEFQELCDKEKKSVSLKLNEMMTEELQKNPLGPLAGNPINIMFDHGIKPIKQEPLDKYLQENFVTSRDWFGYYSKINDIDHVRRHEALAVTISKQAKQRVNYLKTGKYLVQ